MALCLLIVLHAELGESIGFQATHSGRVRTCVSEVGFGASCVNKFSSLPYLGELKSVCTNFRGLFCINNVRLEAKLKLLNFHLNMSDFVGCSEAHSVPEFWEAFKSQIHVPF